MLRLSRKAQSSLEYAVLIAIVAGGLIAMQVYVKRAFQGNMQSSADDIGEQFSVHGLTELAYNYSTGSNTTESFLDGVTSSRLNEAETSTRNFSVELEDFSQEGWDVNFEEEEEEE